jgi:hypothetical protein
MVVNATVYTGDSFGFTIAIQNAAGANVDVSTATSVIYGIFDKFGTSKLTKTLGAGISVAAHIVTVVIADDDTDDFDPGTYIHELQIVTLAGTTHTVMQGNILLLRDYIKAIP